MIRGAIGFDARPLYRKRDGIGTFTEQTILAAARLYPNTQFVGTIFKGDSDTECLIKNLPPNVTFITLPFSWRTYRIIAETGVWLAVDKYIKTPLVGFLYFNFVSLPWVSKNVPKHLMIHDVTFLRYPETVSKPNLSYLRKFVAKSLKKQGVRAFTLSKCSVRLMREYFNNTFFVASPGPTPLTINHSSRQPNGSILFIGTLEPRKNLLNLIRAYALLDEKIQANHNLIIAGKQGWRNEKVVNEIIHNKYIVRIESPSDKEITELYMKASYYVMPSILEGFGIPVLDAALVGIPIVTSVDSSMEEILGKEGAIYVNPNSVESIKNGLIKCINQNKLAQLEMLKSNQKNITKYTWENTAKSFVKDFIKY